MKPIATNTVIPNPCFIGVRDLLVANDEKQILTGFAGFGMT